MWSPALVRLGQSAPCGVQFDSEIEFKPGPIVTMSLANETARRKGGRGGSVRRKEIAEPVELLIPPRSSESTP
jgi:hypothetical protein